MLHLERDILGLGFAVSELLAASFYSWCRRRRRELGALPKEIFLTLKLQRKEGFNVEAAFKCIAKEALKNQPEEEISVVDNFLGFGTLRFKSSIHLASSIKGM
ncbi:hypothetical protein LguiB_011704 [Lonicera macranthoides]